MLVEPRWASCSRLRLSHRGRTVGHYSGYGGIGDVSTDNCGGQQVASSSVVEEGEQVGEEAELG